MMTLAAGFILTVKISKVEMQREIGYKIREGAVPKRYQVMLTTTLFGEEVVVEGRIFQVSLSLTIK